MKIVELWQLIDNTFLTRILRGLKQESFTRSLAKIIVILLSLQKKDNHQWQQLASTEVLIICQDLVGEVLQQEYQIIKEYCNKDNIINTWDLQQMPHIIEISRDLRDQTFVKKVILNSAFNQAHKTVTCQSLLILNPKIFLTNTLLTC